MRPAEFFYASPIYQAFLWGKTPAHLTRLPPPPLPGNAKRGQAILNGRLPLDDQALPLDRLFAAKRNTSPSERARLHAFSWLDDLAATNDSHASETARRLITAWIEADAGWDPVTWAPPVLGTRVASWLTHARLLTRGDNDPLGLRILWSLARQVRHLVRTAGNASWTERLPALRGLIYAAACGLASERCLDQAVRSAVREAQRQVLADGGHVTRSPSEHLRVLAMLVDIRSMLALAGREQPLELQTIIHRMAPMVRFYRHGDGHLTLQNGSAEGNSVIIDAVLARANVPDPPPNSGIDSGFERLAAGRTLMIFDCGPPPPEPWDSSAHAGTLSFEMSCGAERLVVNCGAFAALDGAWALAQRSTAAHSTVTVDDTSSSTFATTGNFRRRASIIERDRETDHGNTWVTAAHNGYDPNFGVIHRRRLYLTQSGDDLRGEDMVTGAHRATCVARFHLHPNVRALMLQNGAAVLLRLPSGVAWRFQATGGTVELAKSVYLGGSERRQTEQIVVSGQIAEKPLVIRWAFKRSPDQTP